MATVDPKDLLAAGGHFGHKTSRWHPKMAPYIYGQRNNTHIIDLTQTVELFDDALKFIEEVAANGEDIMLIGTKRQARELVKDTAESTGMPYVVERWMGGMLTNFSTMSKRIKYLKKIEKQLETGEMEAKYNKLEIQRFEEEIEKLNLMFGGIKDMENMPGAVFIVDVHEEENAVREANRLHIPAVAICDTNADPTKVDYVVPANDDAIKTLELLLSHVKTAIEKGKATQKTEKATKQADKKGEVMADIEQIKKLRSMTGVGLTDAKKALVAADGDFDKALEEMRIKGIAKAEKKAERTASAGLIHSYVHGSKIGVLVEINCETDFVARTDDFQAFANDIALHVAASSPTVVSAEDVDEALVEKERELVYAELKEQGKPEAMLDKIAAGKLDKFKAQQSLLEQPFVKNPDQTVGDYLKETIAKLGENIVIRRFARLELGATE